MRDDQTEVPEDYDVVEDPDDLFFAPGETMVQAPSRPVDGALCVANADMTFDTDGSLCTKVTNLKFVERQQVPNEEPVLRDPDGEVPEDYDVDVDPDDLFFGPGETLVEGPERRVDGAVCVANADLSVNDEGALRVNVDNLPRVTEGDPMEEGEGIVPGTDNILLSRDDRFNFTGGALNVNIVGEFMDNGDDNGNGDERTIDSEFKFVQPFGMIPNEEVILRDPDTEVPDGYDVIEDPDDSLRY